MSHPLHMYSYGVWKHSPSREFWNSNNLRSSPVHLWWKGSFQMCLCCDPFCMVWCVQVYSQLCGPEGILLLEILEILTVRDHFWCIFRPSSFLMCLYCDPFLCVLMCTSACTAYKFAWFPSIVYQSSKSLEWVKAYLGGEAPPSSICSPAKHLTYNSI